MVKRALVLVIVGIGLVANTAAASEFLHPRLKSKKQVVKSVFIVPARVEITRMGIKGAEPMGKESEELGQQLQALIAGSLKEQGITVNEDAFKAGSAGANDRTYAIADLQTRYDNLSAQLHKKPKDIQKGRFSMGDDVATAGGGTSADALVFVRSQGTVLTGGKKAFGLLVGGPSGNGVVSHVTMVDARSGDVLFMSVFTRGGDFVKNPDKTWTKPLANAFKRIPR